ncbi:MAG: exodeoxyribonuclease VII large subunit, partial [Pseudoruegeria sp.]
VARAAAASHIPLISAVGHETDTTLIDFVSDMRAPTPTAAAEMAVPVRLELLTTLDNQQARLVRAIEQAILNRKQRLQDLSRALPRAETLAANAQQRLDLWGERLPGALRAVAQVKRNHLSEVAGVLKPSLLGRGLQEERRRVAERAARMDQGLRRTITDQNKALEAQTRRLRPDVLVQDLDRKKQTLAQVEARLARVAQGQVDRWRDRLEASDRLRQTLGYRETLSRGYAVVRGDGDLVTTLKAAKSASSLEIEFHDGRHEVGGKAARKPKSTAKAPDQGSLF